MKDEELVPVARIRVMQIITIAMIMGVTMFLGVAVVIVSQRGQANPPANAPLISYLAVGMLLMNTFLALMVPHLTIQAGLHRLAKLPPSGDPANDHRAAIDHLLNLRQTALLIANALLEGAAFLAGIAFIVEGNWFAVGLMAAGIVMLLFQLPTYAGVRFWLEKQLGRLEEMRQREGLA